jgi:MFS family permease
MEKSQEFYGWKLVAALWLLYLMNLGFPLYGGTIINNYMRHDIAMSQATYGLAFTLLNFFVGVPSIIIAATVVRWGVRITFLIGSGLIFFGTLWMAFVASQPWHYLLGFGVIISSGIGFGTAIPLTTVITRWFDRYRGRATGLAMTASGIAGLVGAPLMDRILAANGGNWRQAWQITTLISVAAGIIAFFFVREYPEDLGQVADGETPEAISPARIDRLSTGLDWTPTQACKTSAFLLILIASIACLFPFFFTVAHLVPHLQKVGISASKAARALGIFTGSSIAGRLLGGWLMDRMAARFVLILGTSCTLIGAIVAMKTATLAGGYSFAALMGAGFGWTYIAMNTAVGNFFGPVAFPKLMGTIYLFSALVCCPAGYIGGRLFDLYQSYTPAYRLIIAICSAAIIVLPMAKMPGVGFPKSSH